MIVSRPRTPADQHEQARRQAERLLAPALLLQFGEDGDERGAQRGVGEEAAHDVGHVVGDGERAESAAGAEVGGGDDLAGEARDSAEAGGDREDRRVACQSAHERGTLRGRGFWNRSVATILRRSWPTFILRRSASSVPSANASRTGATRRPSRPTSAASRRPSPVVTTQLPTPSTASSCQHDRQGREARRDAPQHRRSQEVPRRTHACRRRGASKSAHGDVGQRDQRAARSLGRLCPPRPRRASACRPSGRTSWIFRADYSTKSHSESEFRPGGALRLLAWQRRSVLDDSGERLRSIADHFVAVVPQDARTVTSGPEGLRVLIIGGRRVRPTSRPTGPRATRPSPSRFSDGCSESQPRQPCGASAPLCVEELVRGSVSSAGDQVPAAWPSTRTTGKPSPRKS